MKITLEMSPVSACSATGCAYNISEHCHAGAITVGDAMTPFCDTFFAAPSHAHNRRKTSGVGPCKVSKCRHNRDFACGADTIDVGRDKKDKARCLTFAP